MKHFILVLLVLAFGLVTAIGINTMWQNSEQLQVSLVSPVSIDETLVATHLAGSLQFRTVSSVDQPNPNEGEFNKLHAYLEHTYPSLHASLTREKVGNNSLLYTWPGSDPQTKSIALMAHQDVVPVEMETGKAWLADPFGGIIKDGFVWGRGAWDNKGNLIAQMEAVEMLLANGFKPKQTIYLVLGDDEEIGGQRGAKVVSALLKERGVRLDYVLDEGLLITEGILPGIKNRLLS